MIGLSLTCYLFQIRQDSCRRDFQLSPGTFRLDCRPSRGPKGSGVGGGLKLSL
jgi:hypothetical protein